MLTAIVLTKNEESKIARCLDYLWFCDEIIVCDDCSTDATRIVAKKYPNVKVLVHSLRGDFAQQRNFALSYASHKWVLFVDADEVVSNELAKEISNVLPKTKKDAFYIHRSDYFLGKQLKYGESGNNKIIRLAKKGSGLWQRKVHEVWQVQGSIGELKSPLWHYPHDNLFLFIDSINFYAKMHAFENYYAGKRSSLALIIFAPIFKFMQNYIFRLGFLDGAHGMVSALMLSFHSFLAWSNLWVLQKKK
ncbi:MAG: glycosyltransferase family 2 protein [Patescibacteria group bacterium]|nr:glycosyltransferase family 2 protein [Patescibacteria group bacterium]